MDGRGNPGRVPVSCSLLDGARDARPVAAGHAHRNTGNGAREVRMACESEEHALFDAPGTGSPLCTTHPPDRSRARGWRWNATIAPRSICSPSAFFAACPDLRKQPQPRAFRRVAVRRNEGTAVLPEGSASDTPRTWRPGAPLDRGKQLGV